jgi:transcriptional regulator with XRE-family HTH domain
MANTLGNTIKTLRIQKSMTQLELANRVGIERSYLTKLENSTRGSNANITTLKAIAAVLGVSLSFLLG